MSVPTLINGLILESIEGYICRTVRMQSRAVGPVASFSAGHRFNADVDLGVRQLVVEVFKQIGL